MTFNGNKINLPTSGIIPLRGKYKIRKIIKGDPLLSHIMFKEGMILFPLMVKVSQEAV